MENRTRIDTNPERRWTVVRRQSSSEARFCPSFRTFRACRNTLTRSLNVIRTFPRHKIPMNRKRVDTNPVRRLAALQRRLRPIPTAFDVLSMHRSCRNMNSIILDIKQRFMKPNGTEKSRTIIDKPELTSNGISTAPPADPGGV